ncbi:hypothetical protein FRIGORI9N_280007 [Frigoribacterium sp. 9N]|nr:hypothetical protein FRIGORI9N_280007 [Frigoribacterium sp. 9N]
MTGNSTTCTLVPAQERDKTTGCAVVKDLSQYQRMIAIKLPMSIFRLQV